MPLIRYVCIFSSQVCVPVECEGAIIGLQKVVSRKKQKRLGSMGHRSADTEELLE